MDEVRPVYRGEKLAGYPSAAHNFFLETARKVQGWPVPPPGTGQSSGGPVLTLELFNTTGSDWTASFPIVKIKGPLFNVDDNDQIVYDAILMEGEAPGSETQIDEIAVVQGPVGDDRSGSAVIVGPTWCQASFATGSETHVAPLSGDVTKLQGAESGARVLWKESGAGTKWALIMLRGGGGGGGGTTIYSGKLTATIPPGQSADNCVELLEWDGVDWFTEQTYLDEEEEVQIKVVGAINRTPVTIRGSVGLPTPVWGIMRDAVVTTDPGPPAVTEIRQRLELIIPPLTGLGGHVTTTIDGQPQAPFHESGSDDYGVDGGPCATS